MPDFLNSLQQVQGMACLGQDKLWDVSLLPPTTPPIWHRGPTPVAASAAGNQEYFKSADHLKLRSAGPQGLRAFHLLIKGQLLARHPSSADLTVRLRPSVRHVWGFARRCKDHRSRQLATSHSAVDCSNWHPPTTRGPIDSSAVDFRTSWSARPSCGTSSGMRDWRRPADSISAIATSLACLLNLSRSTRCSKKDHRLLKKLHFIR